MSSGLFAVKFFKLAPMPASSNFSNPPSPSVTISDYSSPPSPSVISSSTAAEPLTPRTLQAIRREFEREIEILSRFSGDVHQHLISLQAAFRHGDDYCVILPWAESDLLTLWQKTRPGPPLHKPNLEWVLEQCRGLTSGLSHIHVYQVTEPRIDERLVNRRSEPIYGRHGDIKPANILLFRNKKNPGDKGRLVITDFGLTRFHSDGTKTYFSHKGVVATLTYRPPECDMEGAQISPSFDIWSLGCVLLEFIAWYLGGWTLQQDFVQSRRAMNCLLHGFNVDQFFEVVRRKDTRDGVLYSRVKYEVVKVRSVRSCLIRV